MAGFKRITDLAPAGAIAGSELIEVSQVSTTVQISATTISALAADNSFNDSAAGFLAAGFLSGDRVRITGFTGNVANNILAAVVTSVTANKMIIGGVDGDVIVDDAAGETVSIAKWVSRRASLSDAAVADNSVTNEKLADMANGTFKVRRSAGTGNPEDATAAQATEMLSVFTGSGAGHSKGLVPDPGATAGTTKFLSEDGTWKDPPGGGGGGGAIAVDDDTGEVVPVVSRLIFTGLVNVTDLGGGEVEVEVLGDGTGGGGISDAPSDGKFYVRKDAAWAEYPTLVNVVPKTASFTLALTDAVGYLRVTSATAVNCTVPTNASVAFPIGTVIQIRQSGAGQVTIVPATGSPGVTVNTPETLKLRKNGSTVFLLKVDTNTWDLTGDLELL